MAGIRDLGRPARAAAGLLMLASTAAPAWAASKTERVSVGPGGVQANGVSITATGTALSADGRFVAFYSDAANLVPGDSNGHDDIFVRDRKLGTTKRVSVGPGGRQADGSSRDAAISAGGRFVAFTSLATDLVAGDTNGFTDVFVRDRKTGATERVSVGPGGVQGGGESYVAGISANGRFVAFSSQATNLVPHDTNGAACDFPPCLDVFVRDRKTGATERVSVGPGGRQADGSSGDAAISWDGRFVAFDSDADNLVKGVSGVQVYVRDRKLGRTELVSRGPGGVQANDFSGFPRISPDGCFVTFESYATNLVPVGGNPGGVRNAYVRVRRTGKVELLSVGLHGAPGDRDSENAAISADGRFVAFESYATNLVPHDTNDLDDVFVRDRKLGTTERVSVGPHGIQGEPSGGGSGDPAISADGRIVAFTSDDPNLVPHDTNDLADVFVHRR